MENRWTAHASSAAGAALRACVPLWLVLQIVYTPIHLYLEPHSDGADSRAWNASAWVTALLGDDGHDGDGDHERHPAAQHKFKVLRPERAALAEVLLAPAVASVEVGQNYPQPQVFEFSGLSPPELPRSWQFLLRAALPVRAPSLLS
jgi:hypothetical protein